MLSRLGGGHRQARVSLQGSSMPRLTGSRFVVGGSPVVVVVVVVVLIVAAV